MSVFIIHKYHSNQLGTQFTKLINDPTRPLNVL